MPQAYTVGGDNRIPAHVYILDCSLTLANPDQGSLSGLGLWLCD
ncbi:MAG: hypothetical protein NW237_05395 [Cyanobacteriota bacterium]|nr:hypothetical protein [Cyanobacteriota bacterium]